MIPRLQERYRKDVIATFIEKHGYKNLSHVPCVSKVVISMGIKEGTTDEKVIEEAADELAKISQSS